MSPTAEMWCRPRWGDGKGCGALLHPAGNTQEDKVKKALEMASSRKVANLWKGHSVHKLSLLFYWKEHCTTLSPGPALYPGLWRIPDGEEAGPAPAPQSRTLSSQTSPEPIAQDAFAL